ncbi:Hypothetical protein KQS_05135 [Flavobacterium indicum GPTSA100-9 = DSM 17447]|uniref:Uncharacterized protein n=1 Tax=Flavobacterium indicum (strain DSM 17447 / CIP 109464 / GPTSA100-9) TaxID=1094466 RepID=H8XV23_FLAIG|nr:hypothetical protein [Flavobacterium indicum]CCG52993.1 Hypothetical protein KQS_05135 [Flavobacterium indicum GPTSA100-9 = DSM 17447]
MEIEFFETKNYTELIPSNLLDDELCKKIGEKVTIMWFFKIPSEREVVEKGAEMEQPIIISSTNEFSDKLNESFFDTLAEKFDYIYDYDFNQTYQLFFRLNPISPPKYNTRMSWWDSNIICMEFVEAKWKIVNNKIWYYRELFNEDILKFGEVKIKNGR